MKGRARALLVALMVTVWAMTGCRSEPVPSIVGRWLHWEGLMLAEFTEHGEVIYYNHRSQGLDPIESGRYELLSEDRISIDCAFGPSGECTYKVQGVVLLLVNASGTRYLFNRDRQSAY
jgi:hypothetical protein